MFLFSVAWLGDFATSMATIATFVVPAWSVRLAGAEKRTRFLKLLFVWFFGS